MNFLLDATLPPRLARALHALAQPEHRVLHAREIHGQNVTDEQWAATLHETPDAAVLSLDLDISDHPHRIAAVQAWERPVFLLTMAWLDHTPWEQAWMLTRLLPAIIAKAAAAPGPVIYTVSPGLKGRIRKLA